MFSLDGHFSRCLYPLKTGGNPKPTQVISGFSRGTWAKKHPFGFWDMLSRQTYNEFIVPSITIHSKTDGPSCTKLLRPNSLNCCFLCQYPRYLQAVWLMIHEYLKKVQDVCFLSKFPSTSSCREWRNTPVQRCSFSIGHIGHKPWAIGGGVTK